MGEIKFLGTGGARVVVTKQIRGSGGIWLSLNDSNILIDPGPGSLVKAISSRPKLDPSKLNAIILSHKHLDHSGDVNIMMEAMTEGGLKKRGILLAPEDALNNDPVVLKYVRDYVKDIVILKEGERYYIDNIEVSTPKRLIHGAETYGLIFNYNNSSISYISDTLYFPDISTYYHADILIINVVRLKRDNLPIEHLNIDDARNIIANIKPKMAILTHFGMNVIKEKPWEIANNMERELNIKVIAANDGMSVKFD